MRRDWLTVNTQEPTSLLGLPNGPGRDRTCDLGIKSPLLYQLSYRPKPAWLSQNWL